MLLLWLTLPTAEEVIVPIALGYTVIATNVFFSEDMFITTLIKWKSAFLG